MDTSNRLSGLKNPLPDFISNHKTTVVTVGLGAGAWALYNYALSSSNDTPVVNFAKVAAAVTAFGVTQSFARSKFATKGDKKDASLSGPSASSSSLSSRFYSYFSRSSGTAQKPNEKEKAGEKKADDPVETTPLASKDPVETAPTSSSTGGEAPKPSSAGEKAPKPSSAGGVGSYVPSFSSIFSKVASLLPGKKTTATTTTAKKTIAEKVWSKVNIFAINWEQKVDQVLQNNYKRTAKKLAEEGAGATSSAGGEARVPAIQELKKKRSLIFAENSQDLFDTVKVIPQNQLFDRITGQSGWGDDGSRVIENLEDNQAKFIFDKLPTNKEKIDLITDMPSLIENRHIKDSLIKMLKDPSTVLNDEVVKMLVQKPVHGQHETILHDWEIFSAALRLLEQCTKAQAEILLNHHSHPSNSVLAMDRVLKEFAYNAGSRELFNHLVNITTGDNKPMAALLFAIKKLVKMCYDNTFCNAHKTFKNNVFKLLDDKRGNASSYLREWGHKKELNLAMEFAQAYYAATKDVSELHPKKKSDSTGVVLIEDDNDLDSDDSSIEEKKNPKLTIEKTITKMLKGADKTIEVTCLDDLKEIVLKPDLLKELKKEWLKNPDKFFEDLEVLKQINNVRLALNLFANTDGNDNSILFNRKIIETLNSDEGFEFIHNLVNLTRDNNSSMSALHFCLSSLYKKGDAASQDKLAEYVTHVEVKDQGSYLSKFNTDLSKHKTFHEGISKWKKEQDAKTAKSVTSAFSSATATDPAATPIGASPALTPGTDPVPSTPTLPAILGAPTGT